MHKVPRRILIGFAILLLIIGLAGLVAYELVSSALEAHYLAKTAQKMTWQVREGKSSRIRYPGQGPYDVRLGYSKLPVYLERLQKSGWQIDAQAKVSVPMARVADLGLFLPYHEKDQTGLTVVDSSRQPIYVSRQPARVYNSFTDIPPVLVNALLYIENRELLTEELTLAPRSEGIGGAHECIGVKRAQNAPALECARGQYEALVTLHPWAVGGKKRVDSGPKRRPVHGGLNKR